jgi:lipopolysaccharide/colanic/teichoic acid biosynthesis glycosyltransferase
LLNFLRSAWIFRRTESSQFPFDAAKESKILPRQLFIKLLCLERTRTERSGRRFALMLMEPGTIFHGDDRCEALMSVLLALCQATRETDITGWYGNTSTIGVIFTEIGANTSIINLLEERVTSSLQKSLTAEQVSQITLSFQIFPDDCAGQGPNQEIFSRLYPDLLQDIEAKKGALLAKRCLDIIGSLLALVLLSPILILIATAIKTTSRGPILFRQKRLGQFGQTFTFLKFRSMYAEADQSVHKAFVEQFIAAQKRAKESSKSDTGYKIKADPRVTPVGRFLRRTSLDELPQFFNALIGQMALVGPRPPVTYEFDAYEMWHKRRLLAVKPGITGVWQVKGRSRVEFDDMVRMDLEYARTWSVWMDIKILWQTPRAIAGGEGAY